MELPGGRGSGDAQPSCSGKLLAVEGQRPTEEDDIRVCTAFSRLLRLDGIWVRSVSFEPDRVLVTVALRRRRLACAHCSFSTRVRESVQDHESVWRHLDLGVWRMEI